jgi:glutathione-independent formaldehyde dehydrogenase
VGLVKAGNRVVIPTHLYCGVRVNCARSYSAACLRVRRGGFGAAYGYAGMGPYRGAQAELLRVPFADDNCIPAPGEPGDDHEDDFVLLADALVTGWHASELAAVRAGCTVAVFGAGAVGLLAAYSARLEGAAEVYVVDGVPERLGKAGRAPAKRVLAAAAVVAAGAAIAQLGPETGHGWTVVGLLLSLGALAGVAGTSLLAVPLLPRFGG